MLTYCLNNALVWIFILLYSCILYCYDERCKMNNPVRDNKVLLYYIVLYCILLFYCSCWNVDVEANSSKALLTLWRPTRWPTIIVVGHDGHVAVAKPLHVITSGQNEHARTHQLGVAVVVLLQQWRPPVICWWQDPKRIDKLAMSVCNVLCIFRLFVIARRSVGTFYERMLIVIFG